MRRFGCVTIAILICIAGPALAAEKENVGLKIDQQVMGNYEGSYIDGKKTLPASAQIVADGQGAFHGTLTIQLDKKSAWTWTVTGQRDGENPKIPFKGLLAPGSIFPGTKGWTNGLAGTVDQGAFQGQLGGEKGPKFEMKHVTKQSPTLGAKPPQGAIVLYQGGDVSTEWTRFPAAWQPVEGDAMQVSHSDIMTRKEFGDCKLHIEFRTPFMPDARGQGRGNSGVYVQGRYEVQVLDSFGLPPSPGDCGGIYGLSVPLANASLPPTEWQTYDITFRAPRFDAAGKKTEDAVLTVVHNGVTIHDRVKLPKTTPGGVSGEEGAKGPLLLQDHGNAVQYRNIWVLPE